MACCNQGDFFSLEDPVFKMQFGGTFPVVQWPRLQDPNAGGQSLIPGQGIRSYMLQLRPGVGKFFKKERKEHLEEIKVVQEQTQVPFP